MSDDWELLQRFRKFGDQDAFAEVVRRHIDLVWAAAFRISGNADLARDIAQTVFSDLARKAPKLSEQTVLTGWLHRAATFATCRALRDAARRTMRERQAMQMQSLQPNSEEDEKVQHLLPLLDETIGELAEPDRETILLRYFGKKSLAEIGATFGISEDAAQKRLARALERLRSHFRRRGFQTSAAFVTAALGVAGAQAAPSGIAATVAAGSAAAAVTAGGTAIPQLIAHVTTPLAMMKSPVISTVLVAAAVTAPLVYQEYRSSRLGRENSSLRVQASDLPLWRDAYARFQEQQLFARELDQLRKDHDELLKLRSEVETLKTEDLQDKFAWQRRFDAARAGLAEANAATREIEDRIEAQELSIRRVKDMKNIGLATRVWATDNDGKLPRTFQDLTNELALAGADLEAFIEPYEFVEHGRAISISDSNLILFRERNPRKLPNGGWQRAYTMMDGSVQQVGSETGDFSEWERPFIAK